MSINCREDLLNRQAKVNEEIKSYTCRVLVCSGTGCIASGAQKIYEEIYTLCLNMEGMMEMFSKELAILDRNTVKLMVDEMIEEHAQQMEEIAEERKQLDIKYARDFSFWLDMKIIFKTLTAFVQKENV